MGGGDIKNKSITYKFFFLYIPVGLIPLILLTTIFISVHQSTFMRTSESRFNDNLNLINSQIEYYIRDVEMCANMTAVSISEYESKQLEHTNELVRKRELLNILNQNVILFPWVDSIYYYDNHHDSFYSTTGLENKNNDTAVFDIFGEKLEQSSGQGLWSFDNDNFVMSKKVIHVESGKTLGYVFLTMPENILSEIYNQGNLSDVNYYLLTTSGFVLSSNQKEDLGKKSRYYEVLEENVTYSIDRPVKSFYKKSTNNWFLVGEITVDSFMADIKFTKNILMLTSFVCILLSIIMSERLIKWIIKPINKLKYKVTNLADGDLESSFLIGYDDEIGLFAKALENMRVCINELMNKVKDEQEEKREYELALIQEQIKPHFLYNTLDAIYILCRMRDHRRAERMTKALADFYRHSLSGGQEIITIGEELECVRHYLEIQKFRYDQLLTYSFEVDDETLSYLIPKLTLQPIVENALYHGIKEKDSGGHITIKSYLTPEGASITIWDDGVGMNQHSIDEIFGGDKNRFGLQSIFKRLTLFNDGKSKIDINSEVNEFTEVTVSLNNRNQC